MPNPKTPLASQIAAQVEMLNTYHQDLLAEIQSQMRVLNASQEAIAKLRSRATDSLEEKIDAAESLARHVQTLKGRTATLVASLAELEKTVTDLRSVLAAVSR